MPSKVQRRTNGEETTQELAGSVVGAVQQLLSDAGMRAREARRQPKPARRTMPPVGSVIAFKGQEYMVLDTARTRITLGFADGHPRCEIHVQASWTVVDPTGGADAVERYAAMKKGVPVGTVVSVEGREYVVVGKTSTKYPGMIVEDRGGTDRGILPVFAEYEVVGPVGPKE